MKYDKAELVEVEDVLKKPTHKCDVCSTTTTKACARCKTSYFCSAECQKLAWKKHKKTCKAPTTPPLSEVLFFERLWSVKNKMTQLVLPFYYHHAAQHIS